MKDREIISMFDHIRPEVLDGTDLGVGYPVNGFDFARISALKKVRAKALTVRHRRWPLKTLAAFAATVAIIIASVFTATAPQPALGLVSPEYPQGVSYHDIDGKRAKRQDLDEEFLASLSQFAFASAAEVFADGEELENSVYSPLSLYYALALAAEGAAGETRDELLQALHMSDMDPGGTEAGKLFKHLYTDNEIGTLLLANSLWLQKGIEFNQSYLDRAALEYYAYSFNVNFASPETDEKISQWISQHTGGKLNYNPGVSPNNREDQVLAIINTVYFHDQWVTQFDDKLTRDGAFYLANGKQVTAPFMHKITEAYAQGPDFLVTGVPFKNDQQMLFILPQEGISPYEFLEDPQHLAQALTALDNPELRQSGGANLALPKFDFTAEHDLMDVLRRMGVERAFSSHAADFSGISRESMVISSVQQNLSITIDEYGCEAAAYTKIDFLKGVPPRGSVDFILDRPFIFAIAGGAGDAPLFIGVVNNPTAN